MDSLCVKHTKAGRAFIGDGMDVKLDDDVPMGACGERVFCDSATE